VAHGFDAPLYAIAPPAMLGLFVVEQGGRVRILEGGKILPRPVPRPVRRRRARAASAACSRSRSIPLYARNGFVFVDYTDTNGDTRIERYTVSADPNVVDPASASSSCASTSRTPIHNGGHVLFGPDGRLYVGMGDGGSGGDPHDNGQNPTRLLGKLLRIDVDARTRARRSGRSACATRGASRSTRRRGLLYIADVGQNRWEEVDVMPLARPGLNYGWNVREGKHDYKPAGRSSGGMVSPLVEYSHDDGCSITGGFVYRGKALPELAGTYFFSDYCTGWLRSFRVRDGPRDRAQAVAGRVGGGRHVVRRRRGRRAVRPQRRRQAPEARARAPRRGLTCGARSL
jgi:glucose/arabinose dehydrogenase